MTATDIPLRELHENDYNPRTRFDDAAMADLKESIESVGLVQPLTVRENEGGYEVISGIRRLTALRDIHGDDADELVPCNVRDLDDDAAKWSALAENLAREDLTPVEEAWAYAEYVTVDYREEGPETYAEYIKGVKGDNVPARVPTHNNSAIERLSEEITPNPGVIQRRLRILVLPDEVLQEIEAGELLARTAENISDNLRNIPDAEFRNSRMARLSERAVAGEIDRNEAREKSNAARDEWEDRQQQDLERVEGFADAATSAESGLRSELTTTIEWYNDRDEPDEPLDMNGDLTLSDASQTAIEALGEQVAELGGERQTALDDEESDLKQERNRLEQNLEIVRSEDHDRCPFCKASILIPDIEDRVEEYEREIEAVKEQKEGLSNDREAYRDKRSALRETLNEFEDAVSRLRSQLDDKDIEPDELDATVPDAALDEEGGD